MKRVTVDITSVIIALSVAFSFCFLTAKVTENKRIRYGYLRAVGANAIEAKCYFAYEDNELKFCTEQLKPKEQPHG